MSIIRLNQVTLTVGGAQLLDKADWQLEVGDKVALVGRNGAGKSSLLQLLQGHYSTDAGEINRLSSLKVASLIQEVPVEQGESVYHFLVKPLGLLGEVLNTFHQLSKSHDSKKLSDCQHQMDDLHAWEWLPEIEAMASRLKIDSSLSMNELSGGMKRRVLLASALLAKADLLLLDEPTNHLDIEAIEWLEAYLKTYSGAVVVVTHDRSFLSQVATQIVEIDRGKLYTFDCNYETYLDRRESLQEAENREVSLFNKRLAEEEVWLRKGIKARRTRNEGRVRRLQSMREAAKTRKHALGQVKGLTIDVNRSGSLVIEAQNITYSLPHKMLIKNFSLLVTRGDKVGIIGPNGCGKTTLVRLLLGELSPESGQMRLGTGLQIAYFDQLRSQLKEKETVLFNVADGADFVTIDGKSKHVATYLKEFLFSELRFNQPVSVLSGGEKNRLLLAKLLAKPVNCLVMDEPTNDLDIDTLELLEKLLLDYQGTLILISHDRTFINNVVTSLLVFEGEGQVSEYVGDYEDYQQQKKILKEPVIEKKSRRLPSSGKLSFNQQKELNELPKKIEILEETIAKAQLRMTGQDFYKQEAAEIATFNQQLMDDEKQLTELYARWELLEGLKK